MWLRVESKRWLSGKFQVSSLKTLGPVPTAKQLSPLQEGLCSLGITSEI